MPEEGTTTPSLRFCGIDTGETCAVAVRERVTREGAGDGNEEALGVIRWRYFEAPTIERLAERCGRIFDSLGVEGMVIDGGPHTDVARKVYDLLPDGSFIWRHTEGDMTVRPVAHLNTERRHVRINREELLNRLVEEFREGPEAVHWPLPRDEKEEALLADVEQHLMNLRKTRVRRVRGEEIDVFERGENHFGFACAYAKLAEELALSEGLLAPPAGGTVEPQSRSSYRHMSQGRSRL